MAFAAGTRLSIYQITGVIGVGGMGEVYRATDTKLGRRAEAFGIDRKGNWRLGATSKDTL